MQRVEIRKLFLDPKEDLLMVSGWVRNKRQSKEIAFFTLNDGSSLLSLQVVVQDINLEVLENITVGAAVEVKGKVVKSQGKGQLIELHASKIKLLGLADADKYPLQPKKHSLEFLREVAHLRFRTNTFSAITRIRHTVIMSIHEFFNVNGFYNIHTPIITGIDAEGAGELFQVTTLFGKEHNKPLDYKSDFFGKASYLTVTGQLEAELAALGMGKVYTFGPTFRAENSNTTRHLSEFWMVEPEMAFCQLDECITIAEKMLKFVIKQVLGKNEEDLQFLNNRLKEEDKNKPQNDRSGELIEKLQNTLESPFYRITYTQAIDILKKSKPNKKKKFQFLVDEWGIDLQSEHEKFLVEKEFKAPVIVTDYPSVIKAFYMRLNDDNKTVSAMDILFPGIGEIIGGSQREERESVLLKRVNDFGINQESLSWYLETRKFGTVKHSGFGLGLERLLLFVTGMSNIRDVIPFPRTPNNLNF